MPSDEDEEITRAFKIVNSAGGKTIKKSELHLYLFGLGCNLTKKQMDACPASCDEAEARKLYQEYKPEELVTLDELKGIFSTWDEKREGKVSWAQITKPVGDGDDMCEFPEEVLTLFHKLESVKGKMQGDTFHYNDFMKLMASTMPMQTGSNAPIQFDSDLFKLSYD